MSFSIPSMKAFASPVTIASSTPSTMLLHFDGTNGATSTTDSSTNATAITFNKVGTSTSFAALRTAINKFGTASLSNDQTGSTDGPGYISFSNSSLFNLGSNDWTIDFWWYPVVMPNTSNSRRGLLLSNNYTDSTLTYGLVIFNASFLFTADLGLNISIDGSTNTISNVAIGTGSSFSTLNTWYHVAIERHGSNINGYVNGTRNAISTTFSGSIYYNAGSPWAVANGSNGAYSSTNQMQSYMDEFRIVNGTAIYKSSSFTPPASPYTS